MIENLTILTKGGLVLFAYNLSQLTLPHPVDVLIRTVLLEERSALTSLTHEQYTVKWRLANDLDLVFVVVYQKLIQLLFVDQLLDQVKARFCQLYAANNNKSLKFEKHFHEIYDQVQKDATVKKVQRSWEQAGGGKVAKGGKKKGGDDKKKKKKKKAGTKAVDDEDSGASGQSGEDDAGEDAGEEANEDSTPAPTPVAGGLSSPTSSVPETPRGALTEESPTAGSGPVASGADGEDKPDLGAMTAEQLAEHRRKILEGKGFGKKKGGSGGGKKKPEPAPASPPKKKMAEKTKYSQSDLNQLAADLDRSKRPDGKRPADEPAGGVVDISEGPLGAAPLKDFDDASDSGEPGPAPGPAGGASGSEAPEKKKTGAVWGLFQRLTGNKVLERDDLEPVMATLMQHLQAKNVAADIAERLCDSVMNGLIGKKLPSLSTVTHAAKEALDAAVVQILTPRRSVDILRAVMDAKEKGRPYNIVFMGVNGVGKSTTLSKVCFWLRQNGLKVLIAACDTFRAGAVEQLRTHARRLQVPLFEQGYGGDASQIAKAAIRQAKTEKIDVVLIDTAGRMQDNEPLMKSLAKVVAVNVPDLVLFVGEALVGNDAVDQVSKFNQSLIDNWEDRDQEPRTVDGIVLTKFDTIDDKVGAAISMAYTTGAPIVFVGVGQQYTDLRKLNVKAVVKSLLK